MAPAHTAFIRGGANQPFANVGWGQAVLEYGEIDVGEPCPGELRIVQNAIGPKVAGIATVRPDNVAPD